MTSKVISHLQVKMWERGERERSVREDSEEQEKTINNKSSSAINSFEQIFTVSERDEFKNRDLKRRNTIGDQPLNHETIKP